jgi:hypothetical protein
MKVNQLFNNSEVLALDEILGGKSKLSLKASKGDASIEISYEWD